MKNVVSITGTLKCGDINTLGVYTHETSMDVGSFSPGPPSLLNNLPPKVKKGMDEGGYERFVCDPFARQINGITCDCSKRQPDDRA